MNFTLLNTIQEAIHDYAVSLHICPNLAQELQPSYGDVYTKRQVLSDVVLAGLPYSIFDKIQHASTLSEAEMADYLNLSEKSLKRYAQVKQHIFKPIHSERLLQLSHITDMGIRCFESHEGFSKWLRFPSDVFGGRSPLQLLQSSYGREMLFQELSSLEHGHFA